MESCVAVVLDIDSTLVEVHSENKAGAAAEACQIVCVRGWLVVCQRRFWGIPRVQPRTLTPLTPTSNAESRLSLTCLKQLLYSTPQ